MAELKDYLYSINQSKQNLLDEDPSVEKAYPPYIINKCLGSFMDSILFANEMNKNCHLPKKMQYDFFINSLKPRKRFTPWIRKETLEEVELVKQYYGYSEDKALQALQILTKDNIDDIRKALNKGGMK